MERGDWIGAHRVLNEGIRLWRGDAASEAAAARMLRERLDVLALRRVDAHEDRTESLIRLGDTQLASFFAGQVVAHQPLRERSWEQLMRARYLLGDLDGAHRAYGRARSVVAEELGQEPSPHLQRLHAAILRRDDHAVIAVDPLHRLPV